jgi:hypothetical protein
MIKIIDGDIIFCSSKLTPKSLSIYPFRFIIQFTTFSKYEHCSQFINGKIAEATAKNGTYLEPLQEWLDRRYDFVSLDILRHNGKLSKKQLQGILDHWVLTDGAKYPFFKAFFSPFDYILPKKLKTRSLKASQFCSEGVLRGYRRGGIIPETIKPRYYNPQETFELLKKMGFIHIPNIKPSEIIYEK